MSDDIRSNNIINDDSNVSGMNAISNRDRVDNTVPYITGNDRRFDNSLLTKQGVPVTSDDFRDSTERVLNASTTNIVRDPDNKGIWNVEPDEFIDDNQEMDLGKFNKVFNINRDVTKQNNLLRDIEFLDSLAEKEEKISLYDMNIWNIMVNTKNAWFGLLDDLLDQRFTLDTLLKDNRLFYIGLTIMVIASIMYLYVIMLSEEPSPVIMVPSYGNYQPYYQNNRYENDDLIVRSKINTIDVRDQLRRADAVMNDT
jgi:hypothetical protein